MRGPLRREVLVWVRARPVVQRFDAGIVVFTNYNQAVLGTPVGGFDNSGDGRDHTNETRPADTGTKNLGEPSGLGPVPPSDAPMGVLG